MSKMSELYPQYYKDVTDLTEADVYRICDLFKVGERDPSGATHHAIKKLLLPGVRTGGKTIQDDVKEARNTLTRRLDMWAEDEAIRVAKGQAAATAITMLQPQFRPAKELTDQGVHEQSVPLDAIPAYAPIFATTESGLPYMAGVGPVVRDFDTQQPVEGKAMPGWVLTRPGDTLLTFSQRAGIRPYEVRQLNPTMERTGLYDSVTAAVCLRVE